MIFTKELRDKHEELFLEIGEHKFPFEILLPRGLPGSFEHNYGIIRYALTATIDIPWLVLFMLD